MDKQAIIEQIISYLEAAGAAECSIVLAFVQHYIRESAQPAGRRFTFTDPDAIEIAHIMSRCQNSPAFLHKLLVHAINVEDLYITHPRGQQPASK